jgi:hypothetical protein
MMRVFRPGSGEERDAFFDLLRALRPGSGGDSEESRRILLVTEIVMNLSEPTGFFDLLIVVSSKVG